MVVHLNVLTFESQVTIEFHLLTSDTRALSHSVLHLLTVGQCEFLHLFEVLSLGSDSCIEDALSQCDEVSTISHEVSFTLQGDHSGKIALFLHQNTTVRSLTVAALCSNGQSTLTEQFLSLVEVALSLGQSLFYVSQTCAGHSAKLLDIVN